MTPEGRSIAIPPLDTLAYVHDMLRELNGLAANAGAKDVAEAITAAQAAALFAIGRAGGVHATGADAT
jgi:hypothetical protein